MIVATRPGSDLVKSPPCTLLCLTLHPLSTRPNELLRPLHKTHSKTHHPSHKFVSFIFVIVGISSLVDDLQSPNPTLQHKHSVERANMNRKHPHRKAKRKNENIFMWRICFAFNFHFHWKILKQHRYGASQPPPLTATTTTKLLRPSSSLSSSPSQWNQPNSN